MTTRVVATAGHVDHGKSTLVRALTGTDPDRFEEEKRRGLTIDLGFARRSAGAGTDIDIIDVPGHVRFVRNMLAGVGAIDACLFVVAATEGWKPQSEEHLQILRLLGLTRGVVALTMASLVDEDHLELARLEVEERTAGTFLEGADIVAVDVPAGVGLEDLGAALDRLVQEVPERADRRRARLWVDRSFAIAGVGTVVTGVLAEGGLAVGDTVEVITSQGVLPARVRGLQAFGGEHAALPPGCRAAVNLNGPTHQQIRRGDVVVWPGRWHRTAVFDATLEVLPSFPRSVRSGSAPMVYLGSGEHAARLRLLGTSSLQPGEQGLIRLTLPVTVPVLPGDRFVVRDSGSGSTVGGGAILDVDPVLRPSRARPDRSVERVVAERGWIDVGELERLTGERREPAIGSWVVDPDALRDMRAEIRARVAGAGPVGLDVATLDARQLAVLGADDELVVAAGRATLAAGDDPIPSHPFLAALDLEPFAPPAPDDADVDRAVIRELIRRGLAFEEDGIVFPASALTGAAAVAAELLASRREGFSVSAMREGLGTTRRYAIALLARLDRDGVTRRRGDLRIAGPRLPALPTGPARREG